MRIEVAGGIAAGKSTLCNALEQRGLPIIRENLAENPFLTRAYDRKASRGFDVQMAFLLSKSSAIETGTDPLKTTVCDYAMVTEYAYTDTHLRHLDLVAWGLCTQAIDMKRNVIGDPDILIVLDCPASVQMDRIRARGRDFEQSLTPDYVDALNKKIMTYCQTKPGPNCTVLTFRSDMQNVSSPAFIDGLMAQIENAKKKPDGLKPNGPAPAP